MNQKIKKTKPKFDFIKISKTKSVYKTKIKQQNKILKNETNLKNENQNKNEANMKKLFFDIVVFHFRFVF